MKERPILFSAPMVRAILDGRKTQTRRAIKNSRSDEAPICCPYGEVGDRLWVRENFRWYPMAGEDGAGAFIYRATYSQADQIADWKPSIHMPRHACRLVLEIIDVRAERLRQLTRSDAAAEGICYPENEPKPEWYRSSSWPEENFAGLWDSINGPGAWAADPWVWVLQFRRAQ